MPHVLSPALCSRRLFCCAHSGTAVLSLPVRPSQADENASPSYLCQRAVPWTCGFIDLISTKLRTILRGQRLPSLTAQSPTDLRQLGTISTSWGLASEHWLVFDALIPHETGLILESCPFSRQLSAWGRLHCFTKFQWTRAVLGRNVCSQFFESGFPWEGKGEDNLIILKCDFLAELFIDPSASVASGVLSGEMPLKLITSMPPSLSRSTLFPFFFRLLGELCRINCSACSFTKILCWAALRFRSMSKVFSFSFVLSQHRILAEMLWSFFLSVTLHDSDYQINVSSHYAPPALSLSI